MRPISAQSVSGSSRRVIAIKFNRPAIDKCVSSSANEPNAMEICLRNSLVYRRPHPSGNVRGNQTTARRIWLPQIVPFIRRQHLDHPINILNQIHRPLPHLQILDNPGSVHTAPLRLFHRPPLNRDSPSRPLSLFFTRHSSPTTNHQPLPTTASSTSTDPAARTHSSRALRPVVTRWMF